MAERSYPTSNSLGSAIDIFQAVRRAFIQRGLVSDHAAENRPKPKVPKKLIEVSRKSHEILFKANTVFPLTLFPDTITLDREKLTVAKRFFFGAAQINSTPIRDILSVEANLGPFFASLRMSSRYFVKNPFAVDFLWRKDAVELQNLLQGYIIAHEQEIDCTTTNKNDLVNLLKRLGRGDTD